MLSIIKANKTHKESIKQCFMTLFDEGELFYLEKIKNLSLSYVAIDRCNVVKGFILVVPSKMYAKYEIAYLGISQRYRGKGYAKLLLRVVMANLKGHSIWLNTLDNNIEARTLYEYMGFKQIDKFKTHGSVGIVYRNYSE
jgi:ribosomal protein S18 acetylase RimI-like enzyme